MLKNIVLIGSLFFTTLLFAAELTPDHFQRNYEGQAHINDGITYCLVEGTLPNDGDMFTFIATLGQEKLVEIEMTKLEIKEQLSLHKEYVTIKNLKASIQINFDGMNFVNFYYQEKGNDKKIISQFTCGKD
jgi:hypothetical protein